jgi:hypothetical protein
MSSKPMSISGISRLDDMAAQWNLALDIHPLHHVAQWHFGNGYTNLTYADYVHASDSIVPERLRPADIAISDGRIADAACITRNVEAESVHSRYLVRTAREARLDAAERPRGLRSPARPERRVVMAVLRPSSARSRASRAH